MPHVCPTCLRPLEDAPRPPTPPMSSPAAVERLDRLRAACRAGGVPVTWDGYVGEGDAAQLLGKARSTLRNRRRTDRPLPFRKVGGRVQYALSDLSEWGARHGE